MKINSDIGQSFVFRETVISQLLEQKNKKLTTIIAPAGYGKSTLTRQFLSATGEPYAIIRIPENAHFTWKSFLKFLIKSILKSEYCSLIKFTKSQEFLNNDTDNGTEDTELLRDSVYIIIEELESGINSPFILAFDDLQYLGNPDWLECFFSALLDSSTDKTRYIISSRVEIPFSLIQYKSKRDLISFNHTNLKFSHDEIQILAQQVYNKELKKLEANRLHQWSGGWITGLHLLFQDYENLSSTLIKKKTAAQSVYDYFMAVVFIKLDDPVKEYLLRTCFLKTFSAEITNNVLGIENSAGIIESLSAKNIFIEKTDSPHGQQYMYIDLFREFLQKTAGCTLLRDEKKILFSRYAYYFENKKNFDKAIYFYTLAKNYKSIVPLLDRCYDIIIQKSDYKSVLLWLDKIPKEIMDTEPVFLSVYGMVLYKYSGDYNQSKKVLRRAIELSRERENKNIEERALLDYLNVLIAESKQEEAIDIIEAALNKEHTSNFTAKLLLQRATANLQDLKYEDVRKDMQAVLNELNITDSKDIQRARFNMAKSYIMEGNAQESIVWTNLIEEENISIDSLVWKLYIQSMAGAMDDRIEMIFDCNQRLMEIESQYPANSLRKKTRVALSNACLYADYEESLYSFEMLWQLSGTAGDYYLKTSLAAFLYIHLDQYEMAEAELKKAKNAAIEEHKAAWLYFLIAESLVDLYHCKYDEAIKKGLELVRLHKQFNMHYGVTGTSLNLVHIYQKAGQKEKALEAMSFALDNCIRYHHTTYLILLLCSFRSTLDFIIENTPDCEFCNKLYQNMYFIYDQPILSEGYRQRLDILMPQLPDIELRTFGDYELKIRGKTIGKEKWQVNKWQDMLVYFLVNHEHKPTKDSILELFSNGKYGNHVDNQFHQLVSNFRKVLKPEIKFDLEHHPDQVRVVPEYLVYEQKHLSLKKGYLYKIDVLEFQELYEKGMDNSKSQKEQINAFREAIELYKGEFLPGNYDPWCEDIRMKLSWMAEHILDELIEYYKNIQNYEELALFCEKKIEMDPYNEETHLLSIQSSIWNNRKKRAQNKADRMKKLFDQEDIQLSEKAKQVVERQITPLK